MRGGFWWARPAVKMQLLESDLAFLGWWCLRVRWWWGEIAGYPVSRTALRDVDGIIARLKRGCMGASLSLVWARVVVEVELNVGLVRASNVQFLHGKRTVVRE